MPRYEFSDGRAHKFWEIEREGLEVTTRWGRIGASGQRKSKTFPDEARAIAEVEKQTAKKLAKGYALPGSAPTVAAAAAATPTDPGVTDLEEGQQLEVAGSGGRTYTLKLLGGVYSCTCPAWRNQSLPLDVRTCKHLRRLRGDEAETQRIGTLPQRAVPEAKEGPPLLLAARFQLGIHDPTGWWMSEKLDGVRALWDGERFVSRLGNAYLAPDWFTAALPKIPLDGELFAGRGQFQLAVSIARQINAGERWSSLRFVIFDGPQLQGSFEDRYRQLSELVPEGGWPHAEILPHAPCPGADALDAEVDRIEALGGEGVMLRQPGSVYVAGRSDTLLKVKRFLDAEAIVVGHVAGAGRHRGRLGAVEVELPDGTAFKVGTGFSDAQRESPPPIGAVIAFRYQELTPAGIPRFPSFLGIRDDVDWEQIVAAGGATEGAPEG